MLSFMGQGQLGKLGKLATFAWPEKNFGKPQLAQLGKQTFGGGVNCIMHYCYLPFTECALH